MSINYSSGTSTVERILRIAYGNINIGTSVTDSLLPSDIGNFIQDGERYIDSLLTDTIKDLPVIPSPTSLSFAADYLGAYFTYNAIFAANKPGEASAVVKSWKDMAEKAIATYKLGYMSGDASIAGKHTYTPVFDERGVSGIGNGILKDSSDIKTNRYK